MVGVIPTTTINAQASGASIGQEVKIPITTEATVEDGGASATAPDPTSETVGHTSIKLEKWRTSKMTWTGEEQNALGGMASPIMRDMYAQKMRAIVNEMEADCANALIGGALSAGNVVGTAGTTPFATDLKDLTSVYKKLADNGAPLTDLQCILNTTAGMNLRNLTQLQKINEAGDESLLRRGVLGNLFGFTMRESAGFKTHTNGTASGYLVNGEAKKGDSVIAIDTGSGTFKAGDIVTFGSDTTKYVVKFDAASGATSITLTNELKADVADNAAITLGDAYTASGAFARGGLILAQRLPLLPQGGDLALDRTIISDPVSGLSFEVALWAGRYQNTLTFSSVWGVKNIKGEHSVALLG